MTPDNTAIDDQTVTFRASDARRAGAGAETVHLLLLLDDDGGPPERYPLHALPVVIGRSAPADLILPGNMVSRRHCRLDADGAFLVVRDLDSTNGTFVNDTRVTGPTTLADGSRLTIGRHRLRYHRRNRDETADADAIDADLRQAARYIASILPKPLTQGPVRAAWFYRPTARIGGDVFGYQMLDANTFAFFLLDVAGHGTGAGMHAVAVAQVLRERVLPDVDFRDPAAVITGLNARFPMDRNNELFFTIWYGVYDISRRKLTFAAAGHHPAWLMPPDAAAPIPLETVNPVVGLLPGISFSADQTILPPDSTLLLFSDGVFEIQGEDGRERGLADIPRLLADTAADDNPLDIYTRIRAIARPGQPEDDVSLLVFRFP